MLPTWCLCNSPWLYESTPAAPDFLGQPIERSSARSLDLVIDSLRDQHDDADSYDL
jgi:hypothetical protein